MQRAKLSFLLAIVTSTVPFLSARAQELPEAPKPTKEHKWLSKFEGKWSLSSSGVTGPGQPPIENNGTLTSKILGGYWVINKMESEMMGMAFQGIQTIGYDEKTKKYVGTWVDSTNGFMWKYSGTVEKNGKKLVLEADGPDMQDPNKTTKYRDAYEFIGADEITLTSSAQDSDGKWVDFMTGTAKRIKSGTTKSDN